MQPLTPNERREIEKVKDMITSSKITGLDWFNEHDELIAGFSLGHPEHKELWLKVLSMALAQNDAILEEWRKR